MNLVLFGNFPFKIYFIYNKLLHLYTRKIPKKQVNQIHFHIHFKFNADAIICTAANEANNGMPWKVIADINIKENNKNSTWQLAQKKIYKCIYMREKCYICWMVQVWRKKCIKFLCIWAFQKRKKALCLYGWKLFFCAMGGYHADFVGIYRVLRRRHTTNYTNFWWIKHVCLEIQK